MSDKKFFPDIQTGRNLYVDSDKYESDTRYKDKVDSTVHEGFMKTTEAEETDGK